MSNFFKLLSYQSENSLGPVIFISKYYKKCLKKDSFLCRKQIITVKVSSFLHFQYFDNVISTNLFWQWKVKLRTQKKYKQNYLCYYYFQQKLTCYTPLPPPPPPKKSTTSSWIFSRHKWSYHSFLQHLYRFHVSNPYSCNAESTLLCPLNLHIRI